MSQSVFKSILIRIIWTHKLAQYGVGVTYACSDSRNHVVT
jgi:hypothetical protein